jgi:folate-dependent phosphoribosylglycinamide formyltransferase PurN
VQRLVLFTDWEHWVGQRITEALCKRLAERDDQRVIAVCVPRPASLARSWGRHLAAKFRGTARSVFFTDTTFYYRAPAPRSLHALARELNFDVIVAGDANSVGFLEALQSRGATDVAVSVFWKKRFNATFLETFSQVINYHNGSVPEYRGLRATPWSIYRGATHSGFTIHRVNAGLDLGNVLVTGHVPIHSHSTVFDVEWRKTDLAVASLDQMIDAIRRNDPGVPQIEPHKYNRIRDLETLRRIEAPDTVSADDLLRRIRSFGPVCVRTGHDWTWVTGLGPRVQDAGAGSNDTLVMADGVWRLRAADRAARLLRRLR